MCTVLPAPCVAVGRTSGMAELDVTCGATVLLHMSVAGVLQQWVRASSEHRIFDCCCLSFPALAHVNAAREP